MASTAAAPAKAETKFGPSVEAAPAVVTLAGKVAIVTGGSRGIGAASAVRLARDGAKVIVNYLSNETDAKATVAVITKAGGAATAVQADVSTSAGVDRLFAETKRLYGRIDIVVANAGLYVGAPIATHSEADFDRVFAVNVKGVFLTLKAAANQVESNGRIIVIGSVLRRGTIPGIGPYSATKAAVETLANSLAGEVAAKGITVNTVNPGATATDMLLAGGDGVVKFFSGLSPFNRIGTSGEIGDVIAFFASDASRWITGQYINVAGGAKD